MSERLQDKRKSSGSLHPACSAWPPGGLARNGLCPDCFKLESDCRCTEEGAGCQHCNGNLLHAPWCPEYMEHDEDETQNAAGLAEAKGKAQ